MLKFYPPVLQSKIHESFEPVSTSHRSVFVWNISREVQAKDMFIFRKRNRTSGTCYTRL